LFLLAAHVVLGEYLSEALHGDKTSLMFGSRCVLQMCWFKSLILSLQSKAETYVMRSTATIFEAPHGKELGFSMRCSITDM
jgi:hypothetical protein